MQKYYQLSILGIFNMSGHFLQKWWYQLVELFLKILQRNSKLYILGNLGVYLWVKDQVHLWRFPWDVTKILQTYCFRYFGHVWQRKPKVTLSPCRKLSCLFAGKKSTSPPIFLEIFQRYANVLFYAWLHTPKMIVSTCRKLQCLSACQK